MNDYDIKFVENLEKTIDYFSDAKLNCKKDLRNYCEIKFTDTLEEKIDALIYIPNLCLNRTVKPPISILLVYLRWLTAAFPGATHAPMPWDPEGIDACTYWMIP